MRECLLWLSLSCRLWGPNPEVKLSLNCPNHLICVSKASVPVFAQFLWQHNSESQVHKSFSWEVLGLEALTECETGLVSRNIKVFYRHFLWVHFSGKLQKAGKLLHRNFKAELRSKVLLNARVGKWNGCLFVSISHVSLLSQLQCNWEKSVRAVIHGPDKPTCTSTEAIKACTKIFILLYSKYAEILHSSTENRK